MVFESAEVSIIQTKYDQNQQQIWLRETKPMFLIFRFAFLAANCYVLPVLVYHSRAVKRKLHGRFEFCTVQMFL